MNKAHKRIESADIRILRSRRAELQQARSETNEDSQAGNEAQQQEGRHQQHRLTHRIQIVEDQIEEMSTLLSERPVSQDGTISIGYVVTIRIDGGQELSGKTTLSSQTPVGNALLGKRANDVFPVEAGEDQITIEIVKSDVLA
jgi:transcription elongation GreA/GreB family factor